MKSDDRDGELPRKQAVSYPHPYFVKLFTGLKVIPNLPPCFENTGTSDSRLLCEKQPSSLTCSPSSTGI